MKQHFIFKRPSSQGEEHLPEANIIYMVCGIQLNGREFLFEELNLAGHCKNLSIQISLSSCNHQVASLSAFYSLLCPCFYTSS